MTVDKDFFVRVRMAIPTFTVYDAMNEYFLYRPEVAMGLAFDNSADAPFDDSILNMEIELLSSCDAF